MSTNHKYKAVLFDMGGVMIRYSDPSLFERLFTEASRNPGAHKIISDFELGDLPVSEIPNKLGIITDDEVRAEVTGIVKSLATAVGSKDEKMFAAVKKLRTAGYKTCLLTNNGWSDAEKTKSVVLHEVDDFDVVVESCRVRMRKPNADIFELALSKVGVAAQEAIFLDDLKANCDGAATLGIMPIRVVSGDSDAALRQLESLTGLSLL